MRIRVALPILLAAASFMVSAIVFSAVGHLSAQEAPRIVLPRPRGPAPTPPAADTGGEGEGGDETKIREFRTGLEDSRVRPSPPGARVSFNLEDADLPELVRLVSRITGKRFILPSKARSIKATVYSPTDVSAAEAYQAFLSILTLNGLALEPSGRYLKIVESTGSATRDFPISVDGESTPADDRFVTRMHRLGNISAEDAATLLGNFKTEAGTITAYAPTNTLIITDTGASIRRMLRILSEIDVPRTGEQIWIEPVHYAPVVELAERLEQIFPSASGSGASGGAAGATPAPARGRARAGKAPAATPAAGASTVGTRGGGETRVSTIIPDERTNQLIILATERGYLRVLELIRVLDVPVEGEGGVHVYPLQYADSEVIAETLQSLIGGSGGGGSGASKAPRAAAAAASAAGAAGAGAVAGALTGEVSIQAYKDRNALIITASMQDYASLRRVITELDVAPRQVFIEAVIMELQIQRSTKIGISYHGGAPEPGVDGEQGLTIFGFGAQQSIFQPTSLIGGDALTGLAVGVRGPALQIPGIGLSVPSFGAVLTALGTSSDVNVLATPYLIAMDNAEAEINIGANVPLQTSGLPLGGAAGLLGGAAGLGQQAGAAGGLGALAGLAGGLGGGGVQRQTVGTTIRLTPHINDSGEIRLEIEEEISEAGAPQGSLGVVPIQQRTAKTVVLVRDQQTVVIGGLMRDRQSTSETKIPILGDLPIIGALFRTTTHTTEKTNLLLFLTPYVIRTPDDLRAIFERKMRERQEFIDRYFVFGDHEYVPPMDFSRTRGLVSEIMMEVEQVDDERLVLEELRARPPPEHVPRPPVGSAGDMYEDGEMIIEPDDGEEDATGAVSPSLISPSLLEGQVVDLQQAQE